ncbi:hypothetical protein C8R44DRAFT_868965 [Mycena epipterygia]|nr:hypothetical protein C8R44DRAFT_868965 [Mycena epipterygia]
MTGVKRPAEHIALNTPAKAENADTPQAGSKAERTARRRAATAPTHLFVVLVSDWRDTVLARTFSKGEVALCGGYYPLGVARTLAGAVDILTALHDAHETERVLKEGGSPLPFPGLDTNCSWCVAEARIGDKQVRVEKRKISSEKTLATGAEFTAADAEAISSATTTHYAYTICASKATRWEVECWNKLSYIAIQPSAVPGLTCQSLPAKGLARMIFPPADVEDGIVVADERDCKVNRTNYQGVARRWIVRDWESVDEKKVPAYKRAKTA